MERERALELLRKHVKNDNMVKHSLASEAVLRAIARELGEDETMWGLAGLLHDVDVEITSADLAIHTLEAEKILKEQGIDQEIVEAIALHNLEAHPGRERTSRLQVALAAGETLTGLITATALVYPDKKLASVQARSLVKRMKEKAFARTVNRDIILECEKIGIDLPRFVAIGLAAMQAIADDLGL